jgi:D-glycero-D-manno-heptose 1,7-bisphosphate phosphatase
MTTNQAIFLDRDGTINRNLFYPDTQEFEGPREPGELEIYPWTISAMLSLQNAGFCLFIVSNQPNFAKGKTTQESLEAIHGRLIADLKLGGVRIVESFYCLHHPKSEIPGYSTCDCRKPSPRFLFDAAAKYDLELSRSWMVGDRPADIECGRRAGVRTIRLLPDHASPDPRNELPSPDCFAENLLDAATMIINGK